MALTPKQRAAVVRERKEHGKQKADKMKDFFSGQDSVNDNVKVVNRKTRPRLRVQRDQPVRAPKDGLREALEEERFNTAACYAYGFVDPRYPSRGPSSEVNSFTEIVTLTSQTPLTFAAHDGLLNAYPTTATRLCDVNGDAAIFVSPYIGTSVGQGSTSAIVSGWTAGNNVALRSTVFGDPTIPLGTSANIVPLNQFAQVFPEPFNFTAPAPASDIPGDAHGAVAFRTIGLRATLGVTTKALDASGYVYGGDNGDLYLEDYPDVFVSTGGQVTSHGDISHNPLFSLGTLMGTKYRRSSNLGATAIGRVYESAFIPISGKVAHFRASLPCHRDTIVPASRSPQDTTATSMVDVPSVMFFIGNAAGQSFTLSITWTVEMVLPSENLFYKNAAIGRDFVTPFSMLAGIRPAGTLGSTQRHALTVPFLKRGSDLSKSGAQLAVRHPVAVGTGAISPDLASATGEYFAGGGGFDSSIVRAEEYARDHSRKETHEPNPFDSRRNRNVFLVALPKVENHKWHGNIKAGVEYPAPHDGHAHLPGLQFPVIELLPGGPYTVKLNEDFDSIGKIAYGEIPGQIGLYWGDVVERGWPGYEELATTVDGQPIPFEQGMSLFAVRDPQTFNPTVLIQGDDSAEPQSTTLVDIEDIDQVMSIDSDFPGHQ